VNELKNYVCNTCGGRLERVSPSRWVCPYCKGEYENEKLESELEALKAVLDDYKREHVAGLRRNLYNALNEKYTDSERICDICTEILSFLPDDFMASFYYTANKGSVEEVARAIRNTDAVKHFEYVEGIADFILRSFRSAFHLPLACLLEKAYGRTNPDKLEYFQSRLQSEAEKEDSGVYQLSLTRDAFIMYSSKDIDKVYELSEQLRQSGLTCFIAAVNLRHGRDAVHNYKEAICTAIENCRSVIFVSSTSSRSFSCDALDFELPYLKRLDLENSPAEYRNDYRSIPRKYKKPRIEYRISDRKEETAADEFVREMFDGLEYTRTAKETVRRLVSIRIASTLASDNNSAPTKKPKVEKPPKAEKQKPPVRIKEKKPKKQKQVRAKRPLSPAKRNTVISLALLAVVFCGITAGFILSDIKKKNAAYESALSLMQDGEYSHASSAFAQLGKFKDSVRLSEECSAANSGDFSDFIKKYAITEYDVPTHVKELADWSFFGCDSLISVNLPDGLEYIGSYAFSDCYSLKDVTIPDSVEEIGSSAFSDCTSLTYVTLPEGIDTIIFFLFTNCSSLESVDIPDSVSSIEVSAFYGCSSLESISIPKNVSYISNGAFSFCSSLSEISVEEGNQYFTSHDGALFNYNETALLWLSPLTEGSYTVKSGVTSVSTSAFDGCSLITDITLPRTVSSSLHGVFSGCSSLEKIILEDGNESFFTDGSILYTKDKKEIVSAIPTLEGEVTIADGVELIGALSFGGCKNITGIVIPDSVRTIAGHAFSGCSALEKVEIPDSVTSILMYAFTNCTSLTDVTLPKDLTVINDGIFSGCTSLERVELHEKITKISFAPFSRCTSLTDVIFNGTVGQWNAISKDSAWISTDGSVTVSCSDGKTPFTSNP